MVYALTDDGYVGVPIDSVKPKSRTRLQREDNLDADPRGSLLVENWDRDDWSRLWWVRAELHHVADPSAELTDRLATLLADTVPQYGSAGIMTKGAIFVTAGEAVTDGAQVYVTSAGAIVDTSTSNVIAPGWFFDQTAGNGEIVRIVNRG